MLYVWCFGVHCNYTLKPRKPSFLKYFACVGIKLCCKDDRPTDGRRVPKIAAMLLKKGVRKCRELRLGRERAAGLGLNLNCQKPFLIEQLSASSCFH